MSVKVSFRPGIGRIGATIAASTNPASHAIASHEPTPRPFLRRGCTPAVTPAISTVTASATSPVVSSSSARAVPADSGGGSGMANPGVEDRVDAVNERVEQHEREGDERDVGLDGCVLARADGRDEPESHAGNLEHELDDDCVSDERAEVQGGCSQQREARRPEGVPPQDALVRQALCLGHRDEVLLERLAHVAAQEAHIDRDLSNGQDRKSTRLNSSHITNSYAVFCL